MESLGNVSISSAHGCCSAAALSGNQSKAQHKFPPTSWQGTEKLYKYEYEFAERKTAQK